MGSLRDIGILLGVGEQRGEALKHSVTHITGLSTGKLMTGASATLINAEAIESEEV
jgi:hypothetical protein